MRDLLHDVIVAVRRLTAARGFTAFSVLTLAVGIGMTTAIYALISGTILRPPHIRDINTVVNIYHSSGSGPSMFLSLPDIRDLRATQTSFEQMTIWRRMRIGLTTDRTSVSLFAEVVAGNYFEFTGPAAVGLGLIAVAAGWLTRTVGRALSRRSRARTVGLGLVALGMIGVATGSTASALGWSWFAMAGWALAVTCLITVARRRTLIPTSGPKRPS